MTGTSENPRITEAVIAGWLDGQDRTPLSSGSAATATLKALESGGTLAEIAATRLRPSDTDLFEYAVGRTLRAHQNAGVDVAEDKVRGRLFGAAAITRCAVVMGIIGAATGKQYNRSTIIAVSPESEDFKAAERMLSNPVDRLRVIGLVAIASEAIRDEDITEEDRAEANSLHNDYQAALKGIRSNRFPDAGDREVQRRRLMKHIQARLVAGFARRQISGPEVRALINNLLADEPDGSVFAD